MNFHIVHDPSGGKKNLLFAGLPLTGSRSPDASRPHLREALVQRVSLLTGVPAGVVRVHFDAADIGEVR